MIGSIQDLKQSFRYHPTLYGLMEYAVLPTPPATEPQKRFRKSLLTGPRVVSVCSDHSVPGTKTSGCTQTAKGNAGNACACWSYLSLVCNDQPRWRGAVCDQPDNEAVVISSHPGKGCLFSASFSPYEASPMEGLRGLQSLIYSGLQDELRGVNGYLPVPSECSTAQSQTYSHLLPYVGLNGHSALGVQSSRTYFSPRMLWSRHALTGPIDNMRT